MLKGRDIVVIGLQPWYYEIGSNCKNMALHFARYNRVLYVNYPINRKTYLSADKNPGIQQHCSIIKEKAEPIRKIGEQMWEFYPTTVVESINWLPSTAAFKWVNYFNNKRFAKDIKQALQELGFRDIILFNDNDIFNGYNLKELLKPSLYIYYSRDFLLGYDYWKKHCSILEPELIRKADAVVANSTYLAEYGASYNKHSYYIGQGCNLELFDRDKVDDLPEELEKISSPMIGYVGAIIADRLDEQILLRIARARPDWSVVLVGPEDDTFRNSQLHGLPNVHFLGRKPIDQLPHFIKGFDVCINPQLVNTITIGNYPLKVDEYLAMGKPVVATRTKAMELFDAHTYLADRGEDYVRLIEKALAEDHPGVQEERIAFAKSHTWENCMAELYKAIQNIKVTLN